MNGLSLALLPALALTGMLLALLPYAAFKVALGNARRPDGTWDAEDRRRELRRARSFVGQALALPLLLVGGAGLAVYSVHRFLPHSSLARIFGDHHPETHLVSESLVETLRATEQAVAAQPGSELLSWGELFWQHWPLHPLFAFLLTGLVGWLVARRHLRLAEEYRRGVQRRQRALITEAARRSGARAAA